MTLGGFQYAYFRNTENREQQATYGKPANTIQELFSSRIFPVFVFYLNYLDMCGCSLNFDNQEYALSSKGCYL